MNRKGFTLIELLIVVAIISIMAAIVIPKFVQLHTCSKYGKNSDKCIAVKNHNAGEQVSLGGVDIRISNSANATLNCSQVSDAFVTCGGKVYKKVD